MGDGPLLFDLERDELGNNLGKIIPRGSLVLVEGAPGSGKSIIAQRFLYGFLENGHTGTYISTELDLIGFIRQMNSLSYDVSQHIMEENMSFISLLPQVGKPKIKKNLINDLFESKKMFENDCLFVDMVTNFMVDDNITQEECFKIIKTIKSINSTNKTIFFNVDPDQISKTFLNILRNTSDIYFFTEVKMVLGNLLRIMNVKRFKMPGGEVKNAVPYKVIPKTGFSVEIASLS
ncbi:MAG: ATPase domain-containing protein [Nanobdellota archaeon]